MVPTIVFDLWPCIHQMTDRTQKALEANHHHHHIQALRLSDKCITYGTQQLSVFLCAVVLDLLNKGCQLTHNWHVTQCLHPR
jgi:hypothetical protein